MADNNLSSGKAPIIIKKVYKKGHGGHHGGAWKIAYADFVTAMMAFFLLMWLISTVDKNKLRGVAEYFTPTVGLQGLSGIGLESGLYPQNKKGALSPQNSEVNKSLGAPKSGPADIEHDKKGLVSDSVNQEYISIMNNLEKAINGSSELNKFAENIVLQLTPEGLEIQVMDSYNRSVFKPNGSEIQPYMHKFLKAIGDIIKSIPNYISVEGHVYDVAGTENLNRWEVSISRANEIRKYFTNNLIKKDQIIRVIGKSDKEPFDLRNPSDPRNSRVVLLLLNPASIKNNLKPVPEDHDNDPNTK